MNFKKILVEDISNVNISFVKVVSVRMVDTAFPVYYFSKVLPFMLILEFLLLRGYVLRAINGASMQTRGYSRRGAYRVSQTHKLDGISMNIYEWKSTHNFRVQSEREWILEWHMYAPPYLNVWV